MPPAHKRYFLLGLLLLVITCVMDQVSKWLILEQVMLPTRPPIEITSFFNLAMVWNYGISFGLFAARHQPLVLTGVSLLIVAILLRWLYKNTSKLVACALGCVMGGALGNMVDRLRFGAVADFLDFHIGEYHWPAFNVADSFIFIGVVLLCVSSMFIESHHRHKEVGS